MQPEKPGRVWLVAGAACLILGSCAAAYCFGSGRSIAGSLVVIVHLVGQGILIYWAGSILPDSDKPQDASIRRRLFDRHLVILGAFLYASAAAAAIAVATNLFYSDALAPFKAAATQPAVSMPPRDVGSIFALSIALSVIGVLFFVAYRLSNIRDDTVVSEEFRPGEFWGGLLVRCGEAILLVFSLFLIIVATQTTDEKSFIGLQVLPAIALLGGMLIKSFEQLVFGLADRLFKAMEVLLPSDANSQSPGKPRAPADQVVEGRFNQWLARDPALFASAAGTSWTLVPRTSAHDAIFYLDFGTPPGAQLAAPRIDSALKTGLPGSVMPQDVSAAVAPNSSRVNITIKQSVLTALATAAAAGTWP
jgi:hypothetical protein